MRVTRQFLIRFFFFFFSEIGPSKWVVGCPKHGFGQAGIAPGVRFDKGPLFNKWDQRLLDMG